MMKLLTAHDFSNQNMKYAFGLEPERAAKMLRELADRLTRPQFDEEKAVLQEVICYSEAGRDDYTMTTLVVKFAEPMEPPQKRAITVQP